MTTAMPVTESPAIVRWRERFAADAAEALKLALTGKVSLGPYDRARAAESMTQILTEADLARADAGLQTWLAGVVGSATPAGLSGRRFADALVEAFRLIVLLHLPRARAWCLQNHSDSRSWLRSFYFGRSRDPEAALLVVLAQQQTDRALLPLWQNIVRRGKPVEHVRHALTGLRLLPADDAGGVERGIPRALLQGLLDFGEALARQGDRKGCDWLMEIDFLAVVYPLSVESWGRKFREVVQARQPTSTVKSWIDQRYPLALKPYESGARRGVLQPPYFKDIEPLLQRLDSQYPEVRSRLQQFIDNSRHYCRESGDSYYLVRSFCSAGNSLLQVDPLWASELAHEAAIWAPTNPHTWALLARALEAQGDWRRAEAIYWHARRRFPENVQSHSQLAHALLIHGSGELGEAVYRQATPLFPDDPICRSDLAHTLRILDRHDEALAEYRQAQELFHRNSFIARAIADVLIDLGRIDEAADALGWAEQIAPADDGRGQQALAKIRQRLRRAQAGQPLILQALQPRHEVASGSLTAFSDIAGAALAFAPTLGQATLLRRKANGGMSMARELIDSLPHGPEKLIERGLWEAADKGWPEAAVWFDGIWQSYEGDGVLRVHRQRAHVRAGETVDWSAERAQYPDLLDVILTEERGAPARRQVPDEDPSQEQLQDAWFAGLVGRQDATLRDRAEEDYLTARQIV